jgi:hypothetical protein
MKVLVMVISAVVCFVIGLTCGATTGKDSRVEIKNDKLQVCSELEQLRNRLEKCAQNSQKEMSYVATYKLNLAKMELEFLQLQIKSTSASLDFWNKYFQDEAQWQKNFMIASKELSKNNKDVSKFADTIHLTSLIDERIVYLRKTYLNNQKYLAQRTI